MNAVPATVYPDGAFAMQPPMQQTMTTDLAAIPGIVIRQESQWGEAVLQAIGVPWESANKYKVSALPADKHAAKFQGDPARWKATDRELQALPMMFRVEEESSCLLRILLAACGILNLRPLKLHVLENGTERYRIDRPFRCGWGCICPLRLALNEMNGSSATAIGEVEQDCQCGSVCKRTYQLCCCYTCYDRVSEFAAGAPAPVPKFLFRTSLACCGAHNNCCGATCCNKDLIIDILDPNGEKVVATVQKTYAPGNGCTACCRCCNLFSNYVVEFPPMATANERALIMAALFQIDYAYFEKKGNEGGGS